MSTVNATNLRKNLFNYLDEVVNNDETVLVTAKNGNVVMLSEEYYRSLEDTIYLYSIPGMRESIIKGINTPIEECVDIDWEKDLKDVSD